MVPPYTFCPEKEDCDKRCLSIETSKLCFILGLTNQSLFQSLKEISVVQEMENVPMDFIVNSVKIKKMEFVRKVKLKSFVVLIAAH